ncbi:hypothetical protein K523DRAFT_325526 [Schizophyllum commune Tattone D]|nr:hypothetical protein K523DRAFT_325526 [Schizophyllum commune Tattone D]
MNAHLALPSDSSHLRPAFPHRRSSPNATFSTDFLPLVLPGVLPLLERRPRQSQHGIYCW